MIGVSTLYIDGVHFLRSKKLGHRHHNDFDEGKYMERKIENSFPHRNFDRVTLACHVICAERAISTTTSHLSQKLEHLNSNTMTRTKQTPRKSSGGKTSHRTLRKLPLKAKAKFKEETVAMQTEAKAEEENVPMKMEADVKEENAPIKMEAKAAAKSTNEPRTASQRFSWEERYDQCKQFRKKNNHCKIPTSFKENKSLGIWVQEQRRNFKAMMKGAKPRRVLTMEQIDKLNEIGFYWGAEPDFSKCPQSDASWKKYFAELEKYKESHGNFDVPINDENDASLSKLARWTRIQRTQKNFRDTKRKCLITKERIAMLNGIGFDWKGPRKLSE